jgi:amino acid adenylation domain-containing protein
MRAFLLGRAEQLPAPLPFRNFVAQTRLGVSRAEHEAFFREMLGDVDEPTMPFGLSDVQGDGSEIAQAQLPLGAELSHRLRAQARALGVSAASIFHTAFARVLGAVSGRDDVVFGTVLFGRMQGGEGSDRVLGLFINTLPIRVRLEGGVRESVRRTHASLARLLQHEHASLALAQRCSGVPAPAPLFSALFNYRHITETPPAGAGAWEGIEVLGGEERTNYPLTFSADDGGDAFVLTAQTRAPLDPRRMCAFMQTALEHLIAALERTPSAPAGALPVLPADERERVLAEWNVTREEPDGPSLLERFEAQAARDPAAVALVDDGAEITYGELNARANRLARHLRALGVEAERRVALCMAREAELVVAVIAVLKAGGGYVPLDPAYPPERLRYVLNDSTPVAVLADGATSASVQDVLRFAGGGEVAVVDTAADAARWASEPEHDLEGVRRRPDHLAYVIYTSGSTGRPKGVMVSDRNVTRLFSATERWFDFERSDVWALFHSCAFDFSVWEMWGALVHGARLVIVRYLTARSPAEFYDLVCAAGVTVLNQTPSAFRQLVSAQRERPGRHRLRLVIFGGEALSPSTLAPWYDDPRNDGARLVNMYGITETTVHVTYRPLSRSDLAWRGGSPIGRPIPDLRIYLLDAHRQPVPIGAAGEIYVGGAGVARGYLNRPELTAERFVPSPFAEGDRLYKTGDVARYLPDGDLEFLGRNDLQVKVRGFRIELGEIEARLAEHPDVGEAVVLARDDVAESARLVAYYAVAAGAAAQPSADELRAHVAAALPDYMVPAAYVRLEAIPLTANGKADRRALPAPDGEAYARREYEAPAGETETAIARIWCDVLELERVGRHDDFFALGGHSLSAVRVIERMRGAGLQTDVRTLFDSPQLSALAAAAGGASRTVDVPPNRIPAGAETIAPEMLPLVRLSAAEIERIVAAVPGGAPNVQDIYPLAPLQEGILFHHLLASEGDPYLLHALHRFDTRERIERYAAALQAVIDRHDILRTAVVWEELSEPVQVVWRRASLAVEEIALDASAGDVATQLAARLDPRRYRLDVRRAPLIRLVAAYDAARGDWAVMLLLHHLVSDHTALELVFGEMEAQLLGRAEQLPAPLPFRNFVAQTRLGVSRAEHEAFFREMLSDVDEPTVPFGLSDVQGDGSEIAQAQLALGAELSRRLRAQARSLGVSAASIFHTAFARVLGAVSGRDDVVFGTVLFGRMQGGEGSDRVLGLFINTLPIRVRLEGGVRESVRRTHASLARLLHHEHASLALAQRCSGVPAPAPLFSALFNYRHSADAPHARGTGLWEGIEILQSAERTNYPLGFSVDDLGDGFALTAQTDAPADPRRLCESVEAALDHLVAALERAPETPLRRLGVLPEDERRRVLVDWNATAAPYPDDRCVHELFEAQAARDPLAVAVVHDGAKLAYGELNARANRLARRLRALGVRPGERVALCMERGSEMIVALLAVLKAGGAYLPLDPSYPLARLAYMLEDGAPSVVLTHPPALALAREALESARLGATVADVRADAGRWASEPDGNLERAGLTPGDLAYVMYTSGSTGRPKGTMIEHRGVCNLAAAHVRAFAIDRGSRVLQFAPLSFDASVSEIAAALCAGASLHVPAPGTVLAGEALIDAVERGRITHATLPPAVLTALPADAQLEPLRTLIVAGTAPGGALVRRFGAGRRFVNAYGPTETTVCATLHVCEPAAASDPPIGRPIANVRAYVVDAHGEPVPVGAAGELWIGGAGVARGYWNRPELTAQRFVPSPFVAGERLYRSGDLVRFAADGTLEFIGRADFQVKIRGFRIELGEIEARLTEHPAVAGAVVVARDDASGGKRLAAYYTPAADAVAPSAEELRAHLSAALPEYMVPAAYVRLETIPLTVNGKVDRRALPAPDGEAYASRAYEAPSGEVEAAIAAAWCEVLELERVGRHDNFFELGGHSLSAVRVIERLRAAGLHAGVRAVFTAPTLAELAALVSAESTAAVEVPPNLIPADAQTITPEMLPLIRLSAAEIERIVATVPGGAANVQDVYPLAPLQEGVLFHHILATAGDPYLSYSVLRFDTRERFDAFVAALQAVTDRHDILRTAVLWEGLPEPVQVVWRRAPVPIDEVRVDANGDAAAQLVARFDPRRYRLDVRRAPLMRIGVARDGEDGRWIAVLLVHHLAVDHTTLEVVLDEMRALLTGEGAQLPVPLPFRTFVAQTRLGISRAEHEAFFRAMLGDVDEGTAPLGLADVHGDGEEIAQARLALDAALARRLRAQVRALGVSAASVFHLAWARVLAALSGRDDVVFGTVLFGRMQGGEGADRVLGMLINTLPVRIRIGETGIAEAVRETHALLAELLRHEHASLSLAQRCSAVAAPAPLFSAILNVRHLSAGAGADRPERDRAWRGIETIGGEERDNYPLSLSVDDLGEDFVLTAQIRAPYEPERICAYVRTVLEGLVDALERAAATPVSALRVLPEAERRRVLVAWNATEKAYPDARCVHETFAARAAETPEAVAVLYEDERLTYGELNARANRLAHYLRSIGVRPDSRVALCVERSPDMVIALLAVLKAGGAYVPLDPSYPLERLAFMLEDSAPSAILTHARINSAVRELLHGAGVPLIGLNADAPRWADAPASDPPRAGLTPEHLAYVIYTSGSTGRPKGVMIEHRGLTNYIAALRERCDLTAGDRVLQFASPSFDGSAEELFGALASGAAVVLRTDAWLASPEAFWRLCAAYGVSFVDVPTLFFEWSVEAGPGAVPESVRLILISGEAVRRSALAAWFGGDGRRPRLINGYGPTETTILATFYEARAEDDPWRSIGRPIANVRVYVVDAHGEPVPPGAAGELWIGGAGVARGYWNRPELTAQRFVRSPFVAGERVYKTGDLGRYAPDGTLEFIGRADFQVKIRGHRVELGEIEARLTGLAAVREAVVLALEDEGGERRLVAYCTPAEGANVPPAETLRAHVSAALPEHMVPAAYVALESLPVTPNGKLDRKALPAPGSGAYAVRAYEAPAGEVEAAVARVWCEIFGLERVGRHDNFFELGGHSLSAVRMIERLRAAGLHAGVRAVFTAPTLAELAALVSAESTAVAVPPNLIPADARAIAPEMLPLIRLNAAEIERIVATVPGGAANVQDVYPLAPLQEGVLFHHILATAGDPYLSYSVLRFDTRARFDAFVAALQAVIDRHDILRTAILWEGLPEPVQVVWRRAPLAVEEVAVADDRGALGALTAHFDLRRHRLDVRRAPLMRIGVARDAAEGRWIAALLIHHLVGDATTHQAIFEEMRAVLAGEGARLPAPMPFRTFIAQARLGISRAEHEAFFRAMLGDVDEVTAPFGLADVHGDGSDVTRARAALDTQLARRLRAQVRALGVSAASVFHLAWARVLAALSGRDDVVFGTVLFGRMQGGEGVDRVLGMLINTLPLRIRIGETPIAEAVRETHALLAELLRHEHASLSLAQRCSAVAAPAPLFSAILNVRHSLAAPASGAQGAEAWEGVELAGGEERNNFPLTLSVDDLGEDFVLTAQIRAPYEPERICAYVRTVLEGLVDALERAAATPVSALRVLPEAERRRVLVDWNATERAYADERCVHETFAARAAETPEAVAVLYEDARLTYGELNARANRLAHYLRSIGVRPDSRVALCLERSPEMIVALLAVLKAGGAYVPLDPSYPRERLAFMLEDSAPSAILTHARAGAAVRALLHGAGVPVIGLDADAARWADAPASDPPRAGLTPRSLAYVIYTSGSTGRPKGVMIEHRALANYVRWCVEHLLPDRGSVLSQPFSFDATVTTLYTPLLHGGAIRLLHDGEEITELQACIEDGRARGLVKMTPSHLAVLGKQLAENGARTEIGVIMVGGEVLPPQTVELWRRIQPGVRIVNHYGPTETTVGCVVNDVPPDLDPSAPVPIGRPLPNMRMYVVDARLEPVPIGVAGELLIGGVQLARGYWNRPDLTAQRFIASPFAEGERLYRTGDLVRYLPDGRIEFVGRNDFQVKIRGFRIELGEIEARLAEHAGVRDAVVLAREDSPGEKRLVAYYTPQPGTPDPGAETLRAHLLAELPEFMVPAAYVALAALPLSPNGKLDRKALPPPGGTAYAVRDYEPPAGETETLVARCWREVLGHDRIGRDDSFFDLGGHSLSVVHVTSLLKQAGKEVTVHDVFRHPTLRALARRADERRREAAPAAVVPVRTSGTARPLFLVHEHSGLDLYFSKLGAEIDPEVPVYGLSAVPFGEPQLYTVEGIASRLIRTMRAVQPEGPYRLAGWSFGGLVAYEMAAQLAGGEEAVGFLGMFDTYYPPLTRSRREPGPDTSTQRLLLESLEPLRADARWSGAIAQLEAVVDTLDLSAVVKLSAQLGILPPYLAGYSTAEVESYFARTAAHTHAQRNYAARRISVPVHLFRAERISAALTGIARPDEMLGWSAVRPETAIDVIGVPGDHQTMMDEHVASLGAALSAALRRAGSAPQRLAVRHRPQVTIQSAAGSARNPVVCVPGAGDSVSAFVPLAQALGGAWALHGMQPRGWNDAAEPYPTVDAAASAYLRALDELEPRRPVHLLGHSFGGWVALELARRLRERGRTVASLVMIDTSAPDEPGDPAREYSANEALFAWIELLELAADRSFGIDAARLRELGEDDQIRLVHERMVAAGILPRRSSPETLLGALRTFGSALRAPYTPRSLYPDRLDLVVAADPRLDAATNRKQHDDLAERWRRWAPELHRWDGPGNHVSILKPPHVHALARWCAARWSGAAQPAVGAAEGAIGD